MGHSTLKSLTQKYLSRQTDIAMKQGQKALLDRQYKATTDTKANAEKQLDLLLKTQALLLKASGQARHTVQSHIESLVQLALTSITGERYGFKLEITESAGAYTVAFKVVSPAGVDLDPLENCGGGIADIVSMALRIAVLEMYEPKIQGPILLDENFKYLSREHTRTAVEFINQLCRKTGRQIILVTHVPELAAGASTRLEVEAVGDTSKITVSNENINQASLP